MDIKLTEVKWQPAWRIIPSRFPPINLFERVTDPADLEAIYTIEGMTNDRLRNEVGNLSLVPIEDRITGPGSSVIMAAFTHLSPQGNRFTDGSFGVFYASENLNTAIAESRYHREIFLKATNESALELDMRVYQVDLNGKLHDIRNKQKTLADIYHSDNYHAAQNFARELRNQNSFGIIYNSTRDANGVNAAIFKPKILSNCRQERHLCYVWNGKEITTVYQKTLYT